MSEPPDIPFIKEGKSNQVPLNFLDNICPYASFRIVPLVLSIIVVYPRMLTCCQPYVGTNAAVFFFLIAFYCFFAELYSLYFFTFKRRNLEKWIYAIFFLPLEYAFYIVMSGQLGLACLYNHWDFWNRILWNKHLFS